MAIAVARQADLLEREALLEELDRVLVAARAGEGRLVFVGGEAGVGKTTLVERFCAGLGADAIVLRGSCDALTTPRPLGPLLEMAETAPEGVRATVESGSRPHELAAALLDLGRRRRPAVLVLEDVHWADEATLDVVRVLGRRIGGSAALVLATYRDDELEREHPLRMVLGELATAAAISRLAVEPLSREGVALLADGRDVDAGALHALTSGNPFYVTEVLAGDGDAIPDTVRDIVLSRVARLSRAAIAVVEAAAIAPPALDAPLAVAVCGEAVDAVDECIAAGVLRADGGGIAFRHELARVAVEESLAPTRRLALHRAVLLALEDAHRGADLARLAHHAEQAADADAVLRYAPAAGAQASAVGAYREAAAQYARALRFSAGSSAEERAELLEARSRACYLADDQVEAITVIGEAVAARSRDDPAKQARALAELSSYLSCRGRMTEAREAVARATALVEGLSERSELAWVLNARAMLCALDAPQAIELARAGADIATRCGDPAAAAEAQITLGTALLFADFAEGIGVLERVTTECRADGRVQQAARGLTNLGQFSHWLGRHELANVYLPEAREFCEEHTLDLWRIHVLAVSALSALEQGRWTEAVECAERVLEDPRESPWPHVQALLVLSLVRARRGDPDARAPLAAALEFAIPPEELGAIVDRAATHAEIAWLERRLDEIGEATREALADAARQGDTSSVSRLEHWRRLAALPVELPAGAEGPFALGLSGAWRESAAEWTRRGRPYEAALALAEAGDEESLRLSLAELRRLGALPAARIVTRQLRARGVRGLERGPRAATLENPAGLTAQQVAVVRLLAEGLRNAEIAERLVVSRRTVDHHVSAILRKLGARTRGEAVVRAGELGLFAG